LGQTKKEGGGEHSGGKIFREVNPRGRSPKQNLDTQKDKKGSKTRSGTSIKSERGFSVMVFWGFRDRLRKGEGKPAGDGYVEKRLVKYSRAKKWGGGLVRGGGEVTWGRRAQQKERCGIQSLRGGGKKKKWLGRVRGA